MLSIYSKLLIHFLSHINELQVTSIYFNPLTAHLKCQNEHTIIVLPSYKVGDTSFFAPPSMKICETFTEAPKLKYSGSPLVKSCETFTESPKLKRSGLYLDWTTHFFSLFPMALFCSFVEIFSNSCT